MSVKRLVVSVHDVSPAHAGRIDRILDLLARAGIARGVLLVVPDFHGRWPLDAHPRFCEGLRPHLEAGWELALHGFHHRDDSAAPPAGLRARLAARHLTAGEGEFLSLSEAEAARRLATGTEILRRTLGRAPAGFVPPAWLCGQGAHRALAASGLRYSEDHLWLLDLRRQRRRFGPALGWASRTRGRRISSVLGATLLTGPLTLLPFVRLAVHPGDLGYQRLVDSIRASLSRLLDAGFEPSTNLDVLL